MHTIRRLIERATGTRIFRSRTLPRGIDTLQDLRNHLPAHQMNEIFDVGANVGQSMHKYVKAFPDAHIYCFEPVESTFHLLQQAAKGHPRVQCIHRALGASRGTDNMVLQGTSDMFFLDSLRAARTDLPKARERVEVDTVDAFCAAHDVSTIDYLKIDTEGGDLNVLKGADRMLREQRIDVVEVEGAMNCRNETHVPFEALKQHLEYRSYFLFGVYEQVNEFRGCQNLRRSNSVFISEQTIESNRTLRSKTP